MHQWLKWIRELDFLLFFSLLEIWSSFWRSGGSASASFHFWDKLVLPLELLNLFRKLIDDLLCFCSLLIIFFLLDPLVILLWLLVLSSFQFLLFLPFFFLLVFQLF